MNKKCIYIPIEVKARELPSQIFLSKFAIKKGFRVYIGSKPAIYRLLENKKKIGGVYIFKGGLDLKNILKIKKKVNSFIILDQELAPSCIDFRYWMKRRYWPNSEKYIDRYYVIGQHALDIGREVFDEMSKNVVKTGWPSIDMLRQENRKIFDKPTYEIKQKYGDFILFSSAFGFNSRKFIDDYRNLNQNSIWDSIKKGLEDELSWAELTLKEFEKNIEILKKVDEDVSCPQIIIRPHPSEDHQEWKKISNTFKNIKVIFEGDITPWIYAAKALLHRGCASAIPAYMAGKPIGYPILKKEWIKKALPYHLSDHLYNANDIINFCKKNLNQKPLIPEEYSNEFKKNIHIEKKFASEIILEDISKLNLFYESTYQPTNEDKIYSVLLNIRKIFDEKIQFIFNKQKNIGVAPQSQKMPGGINHKEIKDYLIRFSENEDFLVRQVFRDCVMIDNK